jgi:EmrB/QacA subfamily drug resistance transporter
MNDDGVAASRGGAVAEVDGTPPPAPVEPAGRHRHATLVIAGPAVKLTAIRVPTRPPPAERERHPLGGSGWGLPLAVLIVGMFMSVLDTSIVNIALNSVAKDFGVSIKDAQWISTAYSLTEGVAVPTSAWLGARIGHKRLYVWSMGLFTLFSMLCGISQNLGEIITFRILQAVPGGMIPVTCITLLYAIVPREKIGAAMGIYGLGVVVAPGIGPTLGGYFVEYQSWPLIFYVNVPIGILGVFAAKAVLREDPGEKGVPFDMPGFVCIAVGLFAFLLAMEEGGDWGWTGYRVLGLFALAINATALWVIIELQVQHPLLDVRVFARTDFVKSVILVGLMSVALFTALFYLPQFLQSVQSRTSWHTGLVLLPQALVLMILMPVAGRLYDLIGARWPGVVGIGLCGVGLLMLSRINVDIPISEIMLGECVLAAGLGLGMMPIMTGGLAALSGPLADSGSAFNTLTQRVSQSFGVALLTTLITADRAQFTADRTLLIDAVGADTDPRITAVRGQGARGLAPLWTEIGNKAQALALSNAFLVVAWVTLAGTALALLLPSGKLAASSSDSSATG